MLTNQIQMKKSYDNYVEEMSKIADVGHAIAVLQWDKEVNLPEGSARFRSQQVATLSALVHNMFTKPEFLEVLETLDESPDLEYDQKRNVSLTLKDYKNATKFDQSFVIKKSHAISKAYHAWKEAKEKNDFKIYIEPLNDLIKIVREEAEITGYKEHPYDALLDKYEPNLKVSQLDPLFKDLKRDLKPLLEEIKNKDQVNDDFLKKFYDKDKQWNFGLDVLKGMGYDFNMGRQDLSSHPFTTSFSSQDVRVTTRVDLHDPMNMLMSCIHEGGHALYEQGLDANQYGLPIGSYLSLGIHESQSRLWENHVGRSKAFWEYYYPKFQSTFKDQLSDISLDAFYAGINKVQTNLIRTEADELHYHIHVIIRYELEKEIIEGKLKTAELSDAWNGKYQEYLGISSETDSDGILQDIHWSHGSFGYFPTYSLGSLYSAQFYMQALKEIDGLEDKIRLGDSSQLLEWLRNKIHCHGKRYDANDLCKQVTGEELNAKYFLEYAKNKFNDIYI